MKLLSLSLKGFRQHKDTNLEFKPGLTGIIGTNGSGKSTLIEAIAFCFYGSKAIRGKLEQVKTMGSAPKLEVNATLAFEHDNVTYRLERTISDASLFIGGESEAYIRGNVEVANKIASIFAMNYEEFTATFFTEQKGLEFLSGKKGAAERERFIVRLMGYDKLQEIQELLRSDKKDKKNSILGWEASLGDRGKILEAINMEERELALVIEKHADAQTLLDNSEKEVARTKKVFDSLHETYLEYAKLKQKISNLQIRYEEKGTRIKTLESKIKSYHVNEEKLKATYEKLIANDIHINPGCQLNLQDLITDVEKETSETLDKIENLKGILEKEKNDLLEKELTEKAEIRAIVAQISSVNLKNANILNLKQDSPCPTCGQELGKTLLSVKDDIIAELKELNEKLSKKQSFLKELEKNAAVPKDKLEYLDKARSRLKTLSECKTALLDISYSEKEKMSLTQEIGLIRQELEASQNEILDIRKDAAKLNFSEDAYQSAKTQFETCQSLMGVARLQRLKIEGEADKHKALIERSKQSLAEYDQKSAILDSAKRELAIYEKSDQVLTDLRKYLNAQLRPRLSQLASQYLSELSDGRYSTVEISQDFTPRVLEDGEVKMVISGGEEDLLNLCLRLALSNMLAERAGLSFSTLILDEVFGALDDNRRNNVLILLEKLSKRFEQILVITHLEDIREGVHNLISINYNDSSSELEIVDRLKFEDQDLAVNL